MIRNSFIFIPKIGKKTETGLWKRDILTWDDLAREMGSVYREKRRQDLIMKYLSDAEMALATQDIGFFARHLPENEHWRLYREYRKKTVFLDIETTGLSPYYDAITVIGCHDSNGTRIFLKDTNMDAFEDYLAKFSVIVTFNGKVFDVPFIRKFFPEISVPPVHIDLRYLLKSIGFSGPLKKIERAVGLVRDESIREIDGRQAVVLWNRFVRGDDQAIQDLVRYNIADTTGLRNLMDFCYARKLKQDCLPLFRSEFVRDELNRLKEAFAKEFFFDGTVPVPEIAVERRCTGLHLLCNGSDLLSVNRKFIQGPKAALPMILERIPLRGKTPVSMGIDLASSASHPTGLCILRSDEAYLRLVRSDDEILAAAREAVPDVIAIDCSLGLPKGRCCTSDTCECRKFGIIRACEKELIRRGIHVYPTLIPSMQELTRRGIGLSKLLRSAGFSVIESYPGAVQDILGFPRKQVHLGELETDLRGMGIVPRSENMMVSHHEIDALTNAVAGFFWMAGMFEEIGDPEEGLLIIPLPEKSRDLP